MAYLAFIKNPPVLFFQDVAQMAAFDKERRDAATSVCARASALAQADAKEKRGGNPSLHRGITVWLGDDRAYFICMKQAAFISLAALTSAAAMG
ncbi:hypothetical protein [Ralstonia sp. UNC404CL21Col]|uniref:hypothetical protein n=1 Tax=Ralstonia sp. UNC404CL21Col TaxID=1380362 RepID=UPI0012DCBE82|nr:hypothetical protein [Ralstonia sp. UNC404CL21Col]